MKRKVILVTDGDVAAQEAVKKACENLGIYPIIACKGHPTPLSGPEIVRRIIEAPSEPVVVMLDDSGQVGKGPGERALEYLIKSKELDVLGVLAVASNTKRAKGVVVGESVDVNGMTVNGPVDKEGEPEPKKHVYLEGDTSEILSRYPQVRVIGCGDLGKMEGRDDPRYGSPITTQCLSALLQREKEAEGWSR